LFQIKILWNFVKVFYFFCDIFNFLFVFFLFILFYYFFFIPGPGAIFDELNLSVNVILLSKVKALHPLLLWLDNTYLALPFILVSAW
jgi:hypothetical protein